MSSRNGGVKKGRLYQMDDVREWHMTMSKIEVEQETSWIDANDERVRRLTEEIPRLLGGGITGELRIMEFGTLVVVLREVLKKSNHSRAELLLLGTVTYHLLGGDPPEPPRY